MITDSRCFLTYMEMSGNQFWITTNQCQRHFNCTNENIATLSLFHYFTDAFHQFLEQARNLKNHYGATSLSSVNLE